MLRNTLLLVFLAIATIGFAQEPQKDSLVYPRDSIAQDSIEDYYVRFEGDSILMSSIELDEVYLFGQLDFASQQDKLRYYILRRKTLKVYPYAKLAAERLVELNDSLELIKKRRHQRRYTRKVQKYIEASSYDCNKIDNA